MSVSYITVELRRQVIKRAKERCEYCKALEYELYFSFEIDHIIAEVHGGETTLSNLALCCKSCNSHKGPNLSSNLKGSINPIRLFNPRRDSWSSHFVARSDGYIIGLTDIGTVTVELFKFNSLNRTKSRALFFQHAYGVLNES